MDIINYIIGTVLGLGGMILAQYLLIKVKKRRQLG